MKDLHEPDPQPSWHPAIQPMVVEELEYDGYEELANDIHERAEMGKQKYGTLLKPFNGRNALNDLYQEVLDAIVYMRQALYEDSYGKQADDGVYSNPILEDIYQELINIAATIKYENEQASSEALPESPTHMP